jgi:hydrogenase maturation protease
VIERGVPVPASDAAPTGGVSAGAEGPIRVLCLGNELIADDAVGIVAARALARRLAAAGAPAPAGPVFDPAATAQAFDLPSVGRVEVLETALTGMYLLEAVVGASRLVVVDSVLSGTAEPGAVLELAEADLDVPRGGSPHYIGLLEALDLARALGLAVPSEVAIVAVEVGDAMTVGGPMTAPVVAAVPDVVDRVMAHVVGAAESAGAGAGASAPAEGQG